MTVKELIDALLLVEDRDLGIEVEGTWPDGYNNIEVALYPYAIEIVKPVNPYFKPYVRIKG